MLDLEPSTLTFDLKLSTSTFVLFPDFTVCLFDILTLLCRAASLFRSGWMLIYGWADVVFALQYHTWSISSLQLEPWILIDAIRFWLKHFFYLFARLLIVLDLCRSSKLWYSCFESVIMDCVQSPQWHPLNWNKSQLHNREFGPHPWRWKWISIIHFDTYVLNP